MRPFSMSGARKGFTHETQVSESIGAGVDTNMDEVYDEYVAKYGRIMPTT